ncbi:MAG: GTPase [Ruminococcaceae bacterium]|nr:GTPase [Oscillospiraceae bacterium]
MNKEQTPIYLFTGFLESGKTKMIQETLEDQNFNDGCKILLIVCEEGIEEYDPTRFYGQNVRQLVIENESDLTPELLAEYEKKHVIDRVVIEYNGMWQLDTLYAALPRNWFIFQQLFFADASSILAYNANMRSLVFDKLKDADTVMFNRVDGVDRNELHKLVRAVSRRAQIAYDVGDELEYDTIEDPLPFDVNAPVVTIEDRDYAFFYRDLGESLPEWDGRTVKFKGMIARNPQLGKNAIIIGRHVMTCCADDIAFSGMVCNFKRDVPFKTGEWLIVTAELRVQKHKMYGGDGPVLYALDSALTSEPRDPLAVFY